jgi:nucleoside-diphosphate-sugar epimerase
MSSDRSPHLSPVQLAASKKKYPPVPQVCVVTGGTGFVGARLVEMLVERGAKEVRSLDVVPPPANAWRHPRITYVTGDVCGEATLDQLVVGADCVWHNAAAVGPFHPRDLYFRVNYEGSLNVLRACRKAGVKKIVMSSSPSTRFDGSDVDGLTEDQMPKLPQANALSRHGPCTPLSRQMP